jgi:flagellar biosynthetic protein FlhB
VLFIAWLAAGIGHLSQIGLLFSPKSIQPKLNKINPLSGFKRIFSLTSLVKAGLDALKVLAVATIAALTVVEQRERIAGLATLTAIQAFHEIGMLLIIIAWRMLLLLLILAILDLLYQKWKHHNDLKMTKQQVKDEMKQTEGDPETKKRRSRMAQQVAMQRVGAAVPQADVVVTNPEHLSIAIKYEADRMNAPRVVAKGADFLAIRIRQIATQHGIPIVERKPLARALYRDVPVGQEVPPEFYQAVAEVLAYVYRLSGKVAS